MISQRYYAHCMHTLQFFLLHVTPDSQTYMFIHRSDTTLHCDFAHYIDINQYNNLSKNNLFRNIHVYFEELIRESYIVLSKYNAIQTSVLRGFAFLSTFYFRKTILSNLHSQRLN